MMRELLDDGWTYHDTESERLACELESAAEGGVPSALLASFLHLSTHTIGEHLRDWPRALALGKRLLRDQKRDAETAIASERLYAAAILAGDTIYGVELELACLEAASNPLASFLAMRLFLAEALVEAERREEGNRVFLGALNVARRLEAPPELSRRIAVASNNIAWTLHGLASRTLDDVELMRRSAETSLLAWRRCGDWINIELALYLQASVAHLIGDLAASLNFSAAGLELIAANGLRPFDTARFHLLRSQCFAKLGDTEQQIYALDEANRAAEDIPSNKLREQFAAERSNATR